MARGTRALRNEEGARGVLVEAVNQLGPSALVGKSVEKPVEMLGRLRPALGREPRRLVENEGALVLVNDHVANELLLVCAELLASRLPTGRAGGGSFERWNSYLLSGFDPVAGHRSLSGQPKLARSRPARDEVEADFGHVPFEPAIETDPVIVVGYNEGSRIAHERPISES